MNAPLIFGPCGRFKLLPEWHKGETVAYELWDAERPDPRGYSIKTGRYQWAAEAFTAAAWMLGPNASDAEFGATLDGQRFIPE